MLKKTCNSDFLIKALDRRNRKRQRIELRRIRISQIYMISHMILLGDWESKILQDLYQKSLKSKFT